MDALRFVGTAMASAARAAGRRLRHGARRPGWSYMQEAAVELLRSSGRQLTRVAPAEARRRMEAAFRPTPALKQVSFASAVVDGMPAVWVTPPSAGAATLLYLHGGGYVCGSSRFYGDLLARLALAARARVLAVDYRLAPESPFPAAVDDCRQAYAWLISAAGGGAAPSQVVVAGDSAGGGLTLTTMIGAREAGLPLPAGGALLSPWVDLTSSHETVASNAPFDWGDRDYLQHWARLYVGGADPLDPQASPLYADLHGLPPLLVQVGTAELLLGEVSELGRRLGEAGVKVTVHAYDDMVHGFQMMPPVFPVQAAQAADEIGTFVNAHVDAQAQR
jgi:acetyl esterase/lipase